MEHIFIIFILAMSFITYRAFFKNDAKRLYEERFFIIPFIPKGLRAYTIAYKIINIIGLLLFVYFYISLIRD